MFRSIDNCQHKVSADQCHMAVSRAQVYNYQLLFSNDRRLRSVFYEEFVLLLAYGKS